MIQELLRKQKALVAPAYKHDLTDVQISDAICALAHEKMMLPCDKYFSVGTIIDGGVGFEHALHELCHVLVLFNGRLPIVQWPFDPTSTLLADRSPKDCARNEAETIIVEVLAVEQLGFPLDISALLTYASLGTSMRRLAAHISTVSRDSSRVATLRLYSQFLVATILDEAMVGDGTH
jgi:hypothetical protein